MGLYDYFLKEQVKFFSTPFLSVSERSGEDTIGYIGGELKYYSKGDKLPLKSDWYEFPQNFILCSFDVSGYKLIEIENSKLKGFISPDDLKDKRIDFFNSYGEKMKISTKEDINNYLIEKNKLKKDLKQIEDKYFPKGSFYYIKNDLDFYKLNSPNRDIESNLIKEDFDKTWFFEEKEQIIREINALHYLKNKFLNSNEFIKAKKIENIIKRTD